MEQKMENFLTNLPSGKSQIKELKLFCWKK